MPEVAFHTGLPDKVGYACRLLRKAWRQRLRVAVAGDAASLDRLDTALWTFEPQGFVPHARWPAGGAVPARLARTPIWLVAPGADWPPCDVVVNLGAAPPLPGPCGRVVELVEDGGADRDAARRRWSAYKAAGWTVEHHPQGGEG